MGKPRFRHAKYTATVCLCRPPFRPTPSLCRPAPTVIDSSPAPVALSIEPSPRRQGGQSEKNKGFAPRYLCPCPSPRPGPAAVMPWGQRRPRPSAAGPVGLVRRGDPVEPPRARCPRPPCRARVVPVSVVPVPVPVHRSQRWRRSAETAEIDRVGRSRRICGAGGRKWGIWRWVVTPSWSMRARGAPPDRPRGPVRREQWIKTICFVRTRHTFSKICCGNALRAPLIRTPISTRGAEQRIEASDGADPQRPIAAEIDRDGRSRRICGAGGRKWGIWRWVVTLSWSMRGAPPDRPRGRGAVRREEWIKTICFVRTRHTFSKICCGNALRAPLIRTRFFR